MPTDGGRCRRSPNGRTPPRSPGNRLGTSSQSPTTPGFAERRGGSSASSARRRSIPSVSPRSLRARPNRRRRRQALVDLYRRYCSQRARRLLRRRGRARRRRCRAVRRHRAAAVRHLAAGRTWLERCSSSRRAGAGDVLPAARLEPTRMQATRAPRVGRHPRRRDRGVLEALRRERRRLPASNVAVLRADAPSARTTLEPARLAPDAAERDARGRARLPSPGRATGIAFREMAVTYRQAGIYRPLDRGRVRRGRHSRLPRRWPIARRAAARPAHPGAARPDRLGPASPRA